MKILGPGSEFGEYSFFTNINEKFCAKSDDFTTLYKIKRSDFLALIKDENSKEWEKFNMLKDSILFKTPLNFSFINENKFNKEQIHNVLHNCYICDEKDCVEITCNLVHYNPNR